MKTSNNSPADNEVTKTDTLMRSFPIMIAEVL